MLGDFGEGELGDTPLEVLWLIFFVIGRTVNYDAGMLVLKEE